MKKLMMAAAIVCAACIANAASVSWAAYQYAGGEIMDYGYCNDLAAGSSIVLCLMDGTSVKQVLDTAVNDGSNAYSGNYSFSYSDRVINNGDILKVMVMDDKGKFSDIVAATNPEGMDPTVINTLTVSGLADDTWTNDEFVFATGNYSAVPEPTSGLLMLVGLAGLALRRRRA